MSRLNLFFLLPSFSFDTRIKALPFGNARDTDVAKLVVKRKDLAWTFSFWWGLIFNVSWFDMYNQTYNSPNNLLFVDGAPGGVLKSNEILPHNWYSYPNNRTCFVPQASALEMCL